MTDLNTRPFTVMISPKLHEKLKKLATRNGRTVSGEARFALTRYLTKEKA